MNGPDGIGALIGLVLLGVLGYYLLATMLVGSAPWWGLGAAFVFSLMAIAFLQAREWGQRVHRTHLELHPGPHDQGCRSELHVPPVPYSDPK